MDELRSDDAIRTVRIVVETSLPHERLDVYLSGKFPVASRGSLQRLILERHILVDGQPVKPAHHPKAGEVIQVYWPAPKSDRAQPEAIPLEILHEDESLVVVNKPPDMVVHPASGTERHTLVNALLHHCGKSLSGIGGVSRPGIVHRLDKETSGCIVVAKHDQAHIELARQFKDRETRKIYHGIVCGSVADDSGEIRAPIARHASHRKVMTVSPGTGRDAWTTYTVQQRFFGATLLSVQIHTGRTHQIRVHFKYLGYPLVGDATYGKKANARLLDDVGFAADRQMLHAYELSFTHPETGKVMTFRAEWPDDFARAVDSLSASTGR